MRVFDAHFENTNVNAFLTNAFFALIFGRLSLACTVHVQAFTGTLLCTVLFDCFCVLQSHSLVLGV